MIDELDLAFDEEREDERGEKGRHTRRAVRRRNKKPRGRGRTVVALLMAVVLLGALGGGGWYGFNRYKGYFFTPDYETGGTGEAVVEVKANDTITDIGETLVEADVVKSIKAYVEATNGNSRGGNVGEGKYKLRKQMRAVDALAMLLDPKSRIVNGVTIPEGTIALDVYAKLSEFTKIPVADFKKAAADPAKLGVPPDWFTRSDNKTVKKNIEGFLYPATYEIPPKATAEQILKLVIQKFLEVTDRLNFVDTAQNERSLSPYEVLITASIAQAEAVRAEDFPKVSRVIYNRVYTDRYPSHELEIDSSINYSKRAAGKSAKDSDDLLQSELDDKSNPYNTYRNAGLPPTPISNPGEEALKGAVSPADGSWIYFMTKDNKTLEMGYASNDTEYRELYQSLCDNGVLTGSNCK